MSNGELILALRIAVDDAKTDHATLFLSEGQDNTLHVGCRGDGELVNLSLLADRLGGLLKVPVSVVLLADAVHACGRIDDQPFCVALTRG